jgi:hypothetical protein
MTTKAEDIKDLATSADIRPDFSAPINSVDKKALIELMNNEFNAQRVAFDQSVRHKQTEVLEKHKKSVGFDRLIQNIDTAKEELENIQEKKRKEREAFKAQQQIVFDKMRKELEAFDKAQEDSMDSARNKLERAENTLFNKGFKKDGSLINVSGYHYNEEKVSLELKRKVQSIEQELQDIRDAIYPAENQKNKYTALLLACSTRGEAMIVIREVLGNGVIPSIKKSDLPYTTKQLTHEG